MKINDILKEDNVNEIEYLKEELNKIKQNVGQYKDSFNKFYSNKKYCLVHEMHNGIHDIPFLIIKNKKDRPPRDTSLIYHYYFDNALNEKFGIKYRSNALFIFPVDYDRLYSSSYIVFPENNFNMIASPMVRDLTAYLYDLPIDITEEYFIKNNISFSDFVEDRHSPSLEKNFQALIASKFENFMEPELIKAGGDFSKVKKQNLLKSMLELFESYAIFPDQINLDNLNKMLDELIHDFYNSITNIINSYHEINDFNDLMLYTHNKGSKYRTEVMIHAEKFLLIKVSFLRKLEEYSLDIFNEELSTPEILERIFA